MMEFVESDQLLGTFVPIVVYWVYSGIYVLLGSFENYRLHSRKDEDEKNLVSRRAVIKGVLLQQAVQAIVATILFKVAGDSGGVATERKASLVVLARQFVTAMVVLDTWQYFMHRYMHQNKFLYRHIHSLHHRLVVPYAYGALYNHPLEGLILDTVGGAISFLVSAIWEQIQLFTAILCYMGSNSWDLYALFA
ncbi:hypothetical protein Nepgr_029444 [Nepenthes gracilis]|uniref:Fatty acid hydroxylase domain-containing protein n=1 Tax=Nepenthes gracilis TaxID=150966 RepID=A0AAD3Y5J7_NEPGR|nr:hypothetical protein Nepgr_029444 [Nepenthes gracilis]